MKVAIVGNYLPRRCGIATFTANLCHSILSAAANSGSKYDVFVVAMNDNNKTYEYPAIVKHVINQQQKEDYTAAADFINASGADVCLIQHEFGIYGGESGAYLLSLAEQLKIPVITTLHTVLKSPSFHEKHIVKKLGELSQKLIVMSKLAVNFLTVLYKIPLQKIAIIHHGVPDFAATKKIPARFNYPGKKVLSTFGLLGRSKGIETVINALPDVVKKHPDIVYVVLGQTHPNVKLYCGEEYRDFLKTLAAENGVQDHVIFEDSFVDEEDLKTFLLNTDIYITPYLNEGQITSGTVSYAIGAGTCIVSTPFWHAKELLDNNRGRLFAFGDSNALANELNDLLQNPDEIKATGTRAFEYGKKMYWNKVGFRYNKLLEKVSTDYVIYGSERRIKPPLPKFNLEHVRRLTDNTGIAEHANYCIPDYKEGYCLDDNARALLLVLLANEAGLDQTSNDLVNTYLQYIRLMQKEDGRFHNDFTFEKKFADETGSEDSFGRTVWAMGVLIKLANNDSHFQFAKDVFFRALPHFENLQSIRAIANTMIGICSFLNRYPDNEKLIHILTVLTGKLTTQYKNEATDSWKWFEPVLCYDNAILPLALWHSFAITKNKTVKAIAIETTNFLQHESVVNGHISLVGNSWYYKGNEKPANGQQPINAMALVMMYQKAWQVTKEEFYYRQMHKSFSWFLGNNDLGIPLFDEETNGCCDGLDLACVNRNQGAESTISYHLAYVTLYMAEHEMKALLPIKERVDNGNHPPNKLIPFSKNKPAKITAN